MSPSSPPFFFIQQLHVQESRLCSEAIFLKLSMFLFWVQKSLDHLTMWPIVTGRSIRIKEVINQLTGLRGQYCSLQGETVQPLTALGRLGEHRAASTCCSWQHETKITAHKGTYRVHGVHTCNRSCILMYRLHKGILKSALIFNFMFLCMLNVFIVRRFIHWEKIKIISYSIFA